MNHGYSTPGAVAMVMSDGMFYGTFGAMEGIGLGAQDGDWERVGENAFALGATLAGAAIGGVRAGLGAPTTEASLLSGLTLDDADDTIILAARGRAPQPGAAAGPAVVESVGPEVEEILSRPHLLYDASGRLRGVFFGPEGRDLMAHVERWMNDGILSDALHIGGFHGEFGRSFRDQGRRT